MTEPLLLDLSGQIQTERLLLRPPQKGDGPVVFETVMSSLAELRAFPASMQWLAQDPTPPGSERWCRTGMANWILRRDMPWLAFRRDNGRLVGMVGLHQLNWAYHRFEIGWWGRNSELGQGLMTEATRAILDFAFREMHAQRVYALVDKENIASLKLARRAGMQDEGLLSHERCDPDGTPRHMHMLARVREG